MRLRLFVKWATQTIFVVYRLRLFFDAIIRRQAQYCEVGHRTASKIPVNGNERKQ